MPRKGDGLSGRQLDVVVPGVGRITRGWGTDRRAERRQRRAIIDDLVRAGQLAVLEAFKARRIGWAELLEAKRARRLADDSLASDLTLAARLWDGSDGTPGAFTATLARIRIADSTRQGYAYTLAALRDAAPDLFPATATVRTLGSAEWADVWARLADGSAAWRNRIRATVSTFLSSYLGHRNHPYAVKVRMAMGAKEAEPAVPANISAAEFWRLMAEVPAPLIPCYVTLAATGLRASEYLALTAAALRRFPTIALPRTKAGRAEVVQVDPALEDYVRAAIPCRLPIQPRIRHAARPAPRVPRIHSRDPRYHLLYRHLRKASEATGIPCSVHTLRHFYIGEGVQHLPAAFVQQAARHQTAEMTARYAKQRDAQKVADAVGQSLRTVRDQVRDDVSLRPSDAASNHPRTDPAQGANGQ
jgi:integrase